MSLRSRFLLWSAAAAASFFVDAATKAVPHAEVVNNHSHTPELMLLLVGLFLCVLGLWHSRTLAVGAGFMFGGLLGNGGQLIVFGYASDWIPVGGWLTNVADISGAIGLLCCIVGYVRSAVRRPGTVVSR
jgi:lipoprotein signal peptidase